MAGAQYRFCWSQADRALGRRRLLGATSLVLCGERYIPNRFDWWIEGEVLDEQRYAAIDETEAVKHVLDASELRARRRAPEPPRQALPRLTFLEDAIRATTEAIERAEPDIVEELSWAPPHTSDYERLFEEIAWLKAAYATLGSLFAERRKLLLTRP